jgi:hypothetical protein
MLNGKKYSKKQKGDYMIKIENIEAVGWEHAIRGMRNPKNSWNKSDSLFIPKQFCDDDYTWELSEKCGYYAPFIKDNDHKLMMSLAKGGPVHAKYRRMITVYMDVTAPLYWWKEFDTYKVGTVANSCSTMHKIHAKEFTREDFSHEHLLDDCRGSVKYSSMDLLQLAINVLNDHRERFLETKDKKYWWQMIQLLPSSYNQKRTVMLNYEVLHNIYHSRRHHKLDEWHVLCDMIENLPYSEIITGVEDTNETNA